MAYIVRSKSLATVVQSAREALKAKEAHLRLGFSDAEVCDLDSKPVSVKELAAIASACGLASSD